MGVDRWQWLLDAPVPPDLLCPILLIRLPLPIEGLRIPAGLRAVLPSRYQFCRQARQMRLPARCFSVLRSNYQLIDLYENVILPQAEQNFNVSGISYESGTEDFLSWQDAQRNLIRFKLSSVKQVVDYEKVLADLEYYVGKELVTENNDE